MTQGEWFKAANGKIVVRTVTGVWTVEEIEEWKVMLLSQAKLHDYYVNFDSVDNIAVAYDKEHKEVRTFHYPRMKGHSEGVLNVRSKDYSLNGVWGNKTGAKIIDDKMVQTYPNGMTIRFEIKK